MICPSNDELKNWLLDEPADDKIADHLNECSACQSRALLVAKSVEPLLAELPLLFEKPSKPGRRFQGESPQANNAAPSISVDRLGDADGLDAKPVFARHRLLGTLGTGGMGIVCLAEHIELGTLRAIKFLATDQVENSEAVLRFQREWRSISQIEHPHLARAIDCGEESGIHFLILEYIEGRTLNEVIWQSGPLAADVAAAIGAQAASGLATLHEHGFVHRDIKPSNILLGRDGVVRIVDFGLACLHDELSSDDLLTGTHQIVGSPACMAPEQFQSGPTADARSDLYALGCTLFTLLTGEAPYPTARKTIWQIATDHASPDVPDVRDRRSDVGADFALLVKRLMQPVPDERPANAVAVAEELARHGERGDLVDFVRNLEKSPPTRLPIGLLTRIRKASVAPDPTVALNRPRKKIFQRPKTWISIALIAAGSVFIGLAVLAGWQPTGSELNPPSLFPPGSDGQASLGTTSSEAVAPTSLGSVFPQRRLPDLPPEQHDWQPNEPLGPAALTQAPREIAGIDSWTWETRSARGWVNAIRTSFDGSRIALGSADGGLRIYSLPDLELQKILVGHTSIASIRWVTDATLIATDESGVVRLWHVDDGKVLSSWGNSQTPTGDADISHDGRLLAIAAVRNGCRMGHITEELTTKIPRTGQAWVSTWSPTETLLACASEDKLRIVRVDDSAVEIFSRQFAGRIKSIEWHAGGELVAIAPEWGNVCLIHNVHTERADAEIRLEPRSIQSCRWSPDGKRLAILTRDKVVTTDRAGNIVGESPLTTGMANTFDWLDNRVILISPKYGQGLAKIDVGNNSTVQVGRHHYCRQTFVRQGIDRTLVASGTGLFGIQAGDVSLLWNADDMKDEFLGLDVSNGGIQVAITANRTVQQIMKGTDWVAEDLVELKAKPVDVSCHPTQELAAILCENGDVWFWRPGRSTEFRRKLTGANFHSHIAWSPDGTRIASGVGQRLVVWNPDQPIADEQSFSPSGGDVAWSPDSKFVATSSAEGIRVFSLAGQKEIALLKGQTHYFTRGVAWSPDGTRVAALTETFLRLWETKTWKPAGVIPVNAASSGCVPLAWAPTTQSLVVASGDGVSREYDVSTGQSSGVAVLLDSKRYGAIDADGTIEQSVGLNDELVVIVENANGQNMLSRSEFESLTYENRKKGKATFDR